MEMLLYLLVIIFLAKVLAELSERIGLSGILGGIATGIILGIYLIEPDNEIISFFAELGAIFLLFIVGYMEVNIGEIRSTSVKALIPTAFQILTAFIFGFFLGMIFNLTYLQSLLLAAVFIPTGIGVTTKALIDLNYLSTRPGSLIVSSSIFGDIAALLIVPVIVTLAITGDIPTGNQFIGILAQFMLFIIIISILGSKVFPLLFKYVQRMHTRESVFAFVITAALFSAYLAEILGMHGIIGAFIAGAFLSNVPLAKSKSVQNSVKSIGYGIFIPIFFVYIGISFNFDAMDVTSPLTLLIIVFALAAKLIGGFLGSKVAGLDTYDSFIFATGVMPRAGVELVIISIAKDLNIIGDEIFSAIVLMIAVSVIVTPVALKYAIKLQKDQESESNG